MAIIKSAIGLMLAIIMYITNGISSFIPGIIPEPKSEADLKSVINEFDDIPLADEIIVVESGRISKDERMAIQCLQGLVGRTEATIFVNYGQDSKTELQDLKNQGCTLSYTDENGDYWTLKNLVPRFASHIKDNGYVLFTDSETHAQLNLAFNYATVYGWLAVPVSCEETVKALGMEKKHDLSTTLLDFTHERDFYEEHKDFFRKDCLVHLYSYASGLRDLAVQQKIFITYIEDADYVGRAFRDMIFNDLETGSMILGWCQYEIKFTQCASRFGHYVIPSDHSFNMSILTCNKMELGSLGQDVEAPELDPTKHYVAIVYSDGDNAQWISNGFNEFYTWHTYEDMDIPLTWTFAPQMYKFSPTAVKKAITNKNNDSFITGPSGAGYARISMMSPSEMSVYSDLTAATMLKSGMTTMTLLDEINNELEFASYAHKLEYFARYDNIKGGILQVDPDPYTNGYGGGRGRVFFANDKPFVSVGYSLWHPSGDMAQVTQEWLKQQADVINTYPADINSINGYTVINVHPWTVSPASLRYFVQNLGDNIEVISADEMIAALTENIPHENAKPER